MHEAKLSNYIHVLEDTGIEENEEQDAKACREAGNDIIEEV